MNSFDRDRDLPYKWRKTSKGKKLHFPLDQETRISSIEPIQSFQERNTKETCVQGDLNHPSEFPVDEKYQEESDDSDIKDEDYLDPRSRTNSKNRFEESFQASSNSPTLVAPVTPTPKSRVQAKKKSRICEFCGVTDTPMWRRGPQGKGTLCNACGVKWSLRSRKKTKKGKETVTVVIEESTRSQYSFVNADCQPGISSYRNSYTVPPKSPVNIELECTSRHHVETSPPLTPSNGSPASSSFTLSPLSSSEFSIQYSVPMTCSTPFQAGCCSNSCSPKFRSQDLGSQCGGCQNSNYDPEYFRDRRDQRKRSFEALKKWDHEDGFDLNANKLLGHLLTVVQERVLEEQELEDIKRELGAVKHNVAEESAYLKEKIRQYENSNAKELGNFRQEVLAFLNTQDSLCNNRLIQVGKEVVAALKTGTRYITDELSSVINTKDTCDINQVMEKVKSVERWVSEMQEKMEHTFQQVEEHSNIQSKKLEERVNIKLDQKNREVAQEIDGLKIQAEKQYSYHLSQLSQMEIITDNQERKIPM